MLRLKVLRAVMAVLLEMKRDPAFSGKDLGEILAEMTVRLKDKLGEIDWEQVLELLMELLPLIIALIQILFAV